ncbi:replication initiation protein [Ideonella sp. DXS22W]|uniref:Replication initiation protein n=1 Tax=Pseudaquabacterium inlustre TaxID=2984192 RepID=A0ABU9CMA1_9BURK
MAESLSLPSNGSARTDTSADDARRDEQAVSKANESIAIRPKRGKLTLLSRRIYNALLYHAQRAGVDQPSYTILLSELIDDARFNSNNTELLKTHIRDMQATTIEWHTSIGEQRRWTSTQLLGTVHIHERGRGSPCSITWSYPEPIRERLVKPAHYTKVFLEISAQMRTYAAAVLYELGARYLTSPGRLTMREDLIWWASVLTGRSDIESVDYRILHRDTIKKALIELDTLNDSFRMEVVEHKRGRKVEELQFRVIPKAQPTLQGLEQGGKNVFDLQLVERLVVIGFKRADAQDLYASTDEGALRAAVDLVEARQKNATLPPLDSPAAYLRDALRKGYAGQGGQGASVAREEPATAEPSLEEKMQRLRDEWEGQRIQQARTAFDAMGETERQAHIARFEAECLGELLGPVARSWQKQGVHSPVARSTFFRWLAGVLWPAPVTDSALLAFALERKG